MSSFESAQHPNGPTVSISDSDVVPRVSVVIVAYNRKEYILQAVQSVLEQSVPRQTFEIIVIKNFRDLQVDGFLDSNGVRVIGYEREPWGEVLARGVLAARGDVVSLLDDDDAFEPTKLERVQQQFDRHRDVVFFRDGVVAVTERGEEIAGWSRTSFPTPPKPVEIHPGSYDAANLRAVATWFPCVIASAMSLKRSILLDSLDSLRQVTAGFDLYLFGVAAATGKALIIDNQQLTRYRVHALSTSHSKPGVPGLGIDQEFARRQLAACETVVRLTRGTSAESIGQVLQLISRFRLALLSGDEPAPPLHSYFALARLQLISPKINWLKAVLLLGFIKLFAPKIASQIYGMLAAWRLRQIDSLNPTREL